MTKSLTCLLKLALSMMTTVSIYSQFSNSLMETNFFNDSVYTSAYFDSNHKNNLAIYSGREQMKYPINIENSPYYPFSDFKQAVLAYDKVVYTDIYIKLDTYQDELITFVIDKGYVVALNENYFEYAKVDDYYIYYASENEDNMPFSGYYVMNYSSNDHQILTQTECGIRETKEDTKVVRLFNKKHTYYLLKNNEYHLVKNKRSLLILFKKHKKELTEFIQVNKLKYKANSERFILEVVKKCEELQR